MDSLIEGVVPSDGFYCLTTIKGNRPSQTFFTDRGELVAAGIAASAKGRNAYYAMASFNTAADRTQGNVRFLKSFWLDVDCKAKDPEKDYATPEEGIEAIQHFCKTHAFPRPTIVNSGFGWHVYWVLDASISRDVWQPVADKLKVLCLNGQLRIDPACTADSARILRIPNTLNFRSDPPAKVEMLMQGGEVVLSVFEDIVDAALAVIGAPAVKKLFVNQPKQELSAATKALLGNSVSSFKKILTRCAAGTGCAQIEHGVVEQATLEEPFWRGVLSVAQCCTDKDIAIHVVSKDHPEYDSGFAVNKAEQTKGPYTCATFNTLRSGVCSGCPHWGKITSPIQLGKELVAATEPEVRLAPIPEPEAEAHFEPVAAIPMEDAQTAINNFRTAQDKVTIPVPPKPYLRGQNGGLYKKAKMEDGTFDEVLIYENDFYVHSRLYDPVEGQVLACRLHLPMDGIRRFNIPLKAVGSKDELRKLICAQGVATNDKGITEIGNYLMASARELQHMQKEEKARTQMGWQADKSFVIGDREYSKTGIRHCPPSSSTANYQHMFRMEGDLQTWRTAVDAYNAPGFEVNQFVFLMALGSPLLAIMNHPGMMISLISDESGLGKTTLQQMCNSIWGHPKEMLSMPTDTINAMTNRMGVFNSLALCIDEFTNKSPEVCSDVVYMATHGRGKDRLMGSVNVERVNTTRWSKFTIVSANAAIRDKIASLKASTEGENMRLFEFDMRNTPKLDKGIADATFPLMDTNYGVAGHILATWLVKHEHELSQYIATARKRIDPLFKFNSKERNWSHGVTAAFTMAYIAKELRLHNYDLEHLLEFMKNKIDRMRWEVSTSITGHDSLLSEFLTANHSYVLVVNGLPDSNGLMAPPVNKNINKIVARYEPDTGKLYIAVGDLRKYCVQRQFSYNSLVNLSSGEATNKRISAGAGVVSGAVRVLVFDTKSAGLDMSMWHDAGEVKDE